MAEKGIIPLTAMLIIAFVLGTMFNSFTAGSQVVIEQASCFEITQERTGVAAWVEQWLLRPLAQSEFVQGSENPGLTYIAVLTLASVLILFLLAGLLMLLRRWR